MVLARRKGGRLREENGIYKSTKDKRRERGKEEESKN